MTDSFEPKHVAMGENISSVRMKTGILSFIARIEVSNPAEAMDVCLLCLLWVL